MNQLPIVIFNFRIADLLEEVTKRTSYIGKMRGTENLPHMLDVMALTSGEDFLFNEFVEDAASETYDWLKAFGKKVKHSYHGKCEIKEVVQYKNHGLYVTLEGEEAELCTPYKVENIAVDDDLTDAEKIYVTVPSVDMRSMIEEVNVEVTYTFTVRTVLDGILSLRETQKHVSNKTLAKGGISSYLDDSLASNGLYIPFDFYESGGVHKLQGVDVQITIEVTPVMTGDIETYTYIEYHNDLNHTEQFDVYQANSDCTNITWKAHADILPLDPRGQIAFILERTSVFNENLIHSIDRNIKEAIVNYVIYRWFEYVNLQEAEKFYLKFEGYAHKAQLGMNSETDIQQRKYKLF